MSYREIPEDRILRFPSTAGFKGWKSFFTEESVTHPAKMNLNLLRHIIKTYTKMGDIICDPMAGTGSTIILAALDGRHGIAVEYEEHFCKMIKENIKLTERQSSFKPRGKMFCIQGDTRELSKLLKESDVVITSPPYSGRTEHRLGYDYQKRDEERGHKAYKGHRESYSADPNNISNLPHGDIETIITSPPYSKTISGDEESQERYDKFARGDWKGRWAGIQRIKAGYSKDPLNIGNLKHGDIEAIITSPPYGSDNANLRERKDKSAQSILASTGVKAVSLEEDNIGVLKYGDVDVVVTSPPYGKTQAFHDLDFMKKTAKDQSDKVKKGEIKGHYMTEEARIRVFDKMEKSKIEDPDNIGNLEYGDVDVIVSSPPYADSVKRGDEGPTASGKDSPTYDERVEEPKVYSNDPKNIGNLRHGEVDSVVTSPPYEQGLRHRGQDYEEVRKKLLAQGYSEEYIKASWSQPHQCQRWAEEAYGEDSDNIGNLKSESYLEAMLQCYREFYKVLKNSGKLILVTKNFIRNKQVVRLDEDTIKLCKASGFTLKDRWYFKLPQISFWRILYQKKFPDVDKIEFEDVLIFEKVPN